MIDCSNFLKAWPCPEIDLSWGGYHLRFVQNLDDLDLVLKLRFDVFNLELNKGLAKSSQLQRDQDCYDPFCHNLMVIDFKSDELVGTYRMQTYNMAKEHIGFYSAEEFDFSTFPLDILKESIELGRACIAKDHRNGHVLFLLWKGLAGYLSFFKQRYFFGSCSLLSCNRADGYQLWCNLLKMGAVSDRCFVKPHKKYECFPENYTLDKPRFVKMPPLFQVYINYHSYMCGPPALDNKFRTIDFLTLMDVQDFDKKLYTFFRGR